MIDGNRAYVGYGSAVVILDISNIAAPKLIGKLEYSPPFRGGDLGVHSVQPIPGRNLLFANSEGTGGDAGNAPACGGPMDHAGSGGHQQPRPAAPDLHFSRARAACK